MPGYVIHMAVASSILGEKGITNSSFQNAFLLGNIIPDAMARDAKRESHFWDDDTYKDFNRIPNIDNFLEKYKDILDNPFVLGYYTHLLLDNLFVKEYWSEHFELLDENYTEENDYQKVKYISLSKDGRIYPRELFFSDDMYYGDYDRIYPYIFDRYPFVKINSIEQTDLIVDEIRKNYNEKCLVDMINKANNLYDTKENLARKQLKVFELEHIYALMDKVISDVCEYMSHAR